MDDGGGFRLACGPQRCARLAACWLSAAACGPGDRLRLTAAWSRGPRAEPQAAAVSL